MKNIAEDSDQRLVIEVKSTLWYWLGVASFFFLGLILYEYTFKAEPDTDRVLGCIGAFVTCGLIYLIFYERAKFIFDFQHDQLNWWRKRGFSEKKADLSHAAIRTVVLQSHMGSSMYAPSNRIVIKTSSNEEIPITVAYEPDERNEIIADRIRQRLGLKKDLITDSIEHMVEDGRKLDAIRLLREKENISLEEAKERIEQVNKKN